MADPNGATNFTQQFAINGQRGVEAMFAMDGAGHQRSGEGGGTFSNFNVDAVDEIQSISGCYAGGDGSRVLRIHEHSYADRRQGFHGSAFEFLRNSALDARNYFDFSSPAQSGADPAVSAQ